MTLFQNILNKTSTFYKGGLFLFSKTTSFFFWKMQHLFSVQKPNFSGEKTTFFLYRTPLCFSDTFYHLKTVD
jgi:hypothetical protein